MRKGFLYGTLIALSFSLMSAMCSSDDDGISDDNSQQIAEVENIAAAGLWRITNFEDSGQDETNNFTGYEFTFASNGELTATNGTTTYTGTWSISADDDNSNDSSSNDDDGTDDDSALEFNIDFSVPNTNDFDDLDDDWDILSYTDTVINLIDISGGNGGTDVLTFERN